MRTDKYVEMKVVRTIVIEGNADWVKQTLGRSLLKIDGPDISLGGEKGGRMYESKRMVYTNPAGSNSAGSGGGGFWTAEGTRNVEEYNNHD